MVWCASTEIFISPGPAHWTLEAFEKAMDANDPTIAPSMLYAWAAIMEGVPFANGAPNLTCDFPAMEQLAKNKGVAIGGKDFKTGQTMVKTVLSPMFKARMLGVAGWYSTNILGNRDGEVLDDPESFKTKEESKLGVLEHILQPQLYPELYGKMYHKVRINYYPPRGDNKEGWDNIDIFGWLGYPMQIKVDFLCRDSILAAPLVLDLALFFDLAQRAGMSRHPGVALVLLQEPADGARPLPRARPVHPAHQAQEHAALADGRGADHAPGHRVLPARHEVLPSDHRVAQTRCWRAPRSSSARRLQPVEEAARRRRFAGAIGQVAVSVEAEGGHYTRITVETNQAGESEADRLAKRFLTLVHTMAEPSHAPRWRRTEPDPETSR